MTCVGAFATIVANRPIRIGADAPHVGLWYTASGVPLGAASSECLAAAGRSFCLSRRRPLDEKAAAGYL